MLRCNLVHMALKELEFQETWPSTKCLHHISGTCKGLAQPSELWSPPRNPRNQIIRPAATTSHRLYSLEICPNTEKINIELPLLCIDSTPWTCEEEDDENKSLGYGSGSKAFLPCAFCFFFLLFCVECVEFMYARSDLLRQCIDALAGAINKFSGGVVLATKLTPIRLYTKCVTKELYDIIK